MKLIHAERYSNLFLALSVLFLLFGQFSFYKVEAKHTQLIDNITSAMDTQIKVIDIRETMNEALIRYLISINPMINVTSEDLSDYTNGEITKEQIIKDYFTPKDNLITYFMQTAALNDARKRWEDKSWESLLISFQIERNSISSWLINAIVFNSFGILFLILGIYFNWKVIKLSRNSHI